MHPFSVEPAIVKWLNSLFQHRLHKDLRLHYSVANQTWLLSFPGEDNVLVLPSLSALYSLGAQPNLPCANWLPGSEGFHLYEANLACPGLHKIPLPLFEVSANTYTFRYDIIGLAYWMLTRCEEINPPPNFKDSHDRFSISGCHSFRYGYFDRPIVDEWFLILRQLISRIWPRLVLIHPQYQVFVSHDVDRPSAFAFSGKLQYLKNLTGDLVKRRSPQEAFLRTLIRFNSNHQLHVLDPFNSFDWLMDTSESFGIPSSFYFISGRTHSNYESDYDLAHPSLLHLLRRIHQRGHEIGLHPSYGACLDPFQMVTEANYLNMVCESQRISQSMWGGRMHYLRWHWPTTAYGWQQAGFQYDSTLGFPDTPGFRCGTCHSYIMFDPVAKCELQLIERPLILMDCSVISDFYLGLGIGNKAFDIINHLINRCRYVAGQFTLLWHNDSLVTSQEKSFYRQVLLSACHL